MIVSLFFLFLVAIPLISCSGFSGKGFQTLKPSVAMCPCHSSRLYGDCCQLYHELSDFDPFSDLESLVRARYSAYSMGKADFIARSTHPSHEEFVSEERKRERRAWLARIKDFSKNHEFLSLGFPSDSPSLTITDSEALIRFEARLKRISDGSLFDLSETSQFRPRPGSAEDPNPDSEPSPGPGWLYSRAIQATATEIVK